MHLRTTFASPLLLLVGLAPLGKADPSILPLSGGNYWKMTNSYSGAQYSVSLENTRTIGTKVMTLFRIKTTVWELSLLVSPNGEDIVMEGIDYSPAARMYLDRPMPLFTASAAAGTSWQSALGRVTLLSRTATVTSPKGTFSNCLQFRMDFGGSTLDWYFAPGMGPVRMGTDSFSFLLTDYRSLAYTPPAGVSQTGACPPVGVTPNPAAQGDHTTAGQLARLLMARDAGTRFLHLSASWKELEPSPGTFNFAELRRYMDWAKQYGMKAALTIKTVDSTSLSVPADLASLPLDHPTLTTRFKALLAALSSGITSAVTHINIANEANTYLDARPQAIAAFLSFYLAGVGQLKASGVTAPIGVTFAYSDFRRNDATFRVVSPYCEQISFTYYPLRPDWTLRDIADVSWDIGEMVSAASGKPLALTEVGYPSHATFGGGTAGQSSFYAAVLDEVKLHPGKIQGVSFFLMSDPPESVVEAITQAYSQAGSPQFGVFVGSLGLFTVADTAKPAWNTFSTKAQQLATAASCSSRAIY
ncbi:MAG: beta-galactosidase [Bryobacteraceae bacterium]|nr:beta-galactosidase [Bryobacteraceae bacterium]